MKRRKVPLRMCIVCKNMKPKQELIRIVKGPNGDIDIDLKGKMPGRGAYICHSTQCFEKAENYNLFEKTFHQKVNREVYDQLKDILAEGDQDI